MLLTSARERRILFVGGKGGVGKTSVASASALARADDGGRVLLVSTDPAHNLGHVWDRTLTDGATRVYSAGSGPSGSNGGNGGYVDAVEIDPHRTIERHFATVEHTMMKLLPERLHSSAAQHLKQAKSAPGSHEAAVLERIAEIAEDGRAHYDLILFDTAPSGHTLRLLALPERLTGWTETLLESRKRSDRFAAAARGIAGTKDEGSSGDIRLRRTLIARRDRFAALRDAIVDPRTTGFIIVTLAENMPVAETLEIADQLDELGIDVADIVVNGRSPADDGAFLAERRQREDKYVLKLGQKLAAVPMIELPLMSRDMTGVDALGDLAALLSGE